VPLIPPTPRAQYNTIGVKFNAVVADLGIDNLWERLLRSLVQLSTEDPDFCQKSTKAMLKAAKKMDDQTGHSNLRRVVPLISHELSKTFLKKPIDATLSICFDMLVSNGRQMLDTIRHHYSSLVLLPSTIKLENIRDCLRMR
jgi:hypothetical protein